MWRATSAHLDVWIRELSRAGLSASAQQRLPATLATTIDCRARYFLDAPRPYLARVKDLLVSALLPQKGPLTITRDPPASPECIPRARAWELVRLELPLLGGSRRQVNELHIVLVDVVSMLARNEFPLTAPPRWLTELFEMLGRAAPLKMEANKWSLSATPTIDLEPQAFIKAVS